MKDPKSLTAYWLENIVVGLDLCPFARKPFEQGQIRTSLCEKASEEEWLNFFFEELEMINEEDSEDLSTSLMIFSNGPEDFSEFYDFYCDLENLLEEAELDQYFQLVCFHPRFKFEATEDQDISNFVNRSPYPVIQIIRTPDLEATNMTPEKAEEISFNNGEKLSCLSSEEFRRLFFYLE